MRRCSQRRRPLEYGFEQLGRRAEPIFQIQRFGKAEKIEEARPFQVYTFEDGHIRVIWSDADKSITTVNVVR